LIPDDDALGSPGCPACYRNRHVRGPERTDRDDRKPRIGRDARHSPQLA
jgi:hypothetical protein